MQVGQVICLQSLSVLTSVAPIVTPTTPIITTSAPTPAPITLRPNECVPYTVIAGDSCWIIANRFMITINQLQINNPSINCALLQIGENICVQSVSTTTLATTIAPTGCRRAYTVTSGDNCLRIVGILGVTFEQLRACNPIINPACTNLAIAQVISY